MAFTLQKIVNKKKLYLVSDFETHHRPEKLHGELVTFADAVSSGPLMEGTTNQNDAITFKSFAQAKQFKQKYRLTNWDINFIANPKISQKEPKIYKSKVTQVKAQVLPAFTI